MLRSSRKSTSTRRRAPEILPAKEEIKKIAADCIKQATAKGHDPEVWRLEDNWGEVRCKKCELVAGIAMFPPAGGKNSAGPMLNVNCKFGDGA